ncbi:hypothetical protein [Lacticaseibacillus paracasei]|uniref:hypothetical protein n=1 Tax=Lacticaseibacillus paracasei TaxID=1597 RepID=UPI000343E97C|nr:hypothetical protein [Lacticaseibacillus paracasei]EPC18104.1 hypothetical protein Lpp230_0488 [Lacticaseibacillus paracasei subsp. paracasei Lpp230]MCT3361926.1 hypothetical protein [Lacticaseibacillus paracasei]UNG77879.1 hypothetical protein LJ555_12020 [Lacticaseibacillus paracasei]
MNYEIVNQLNAGQPGWDAHKAALNKSDTQLLVLGPLPGFFGFLQDEGLSGVNLIDIITRRKYVKDSYMFFDKAPVPEGTAVYMNEDGTISLIQEGETIGSMITYAGTRRAVKELRYNYLDGTKDLIEEYAFDGNHYSNLFYYNDEIQEIQLLNRNGNPVVREFFYQGGINLITINDPFSGHQLRHYNDIAAFRAGELARFLKPEDTAVTRYMGIEMEALREAKSHNVLRLSESPFDDNDEVRGNLLAILKNDVSFIQEVQMDQASYNALALRKIPLNKARVIQEESAK